jgi:hypothetical protein
VRQQFRNFRPALAMLLKFEGRFEELACLLLKMNLKILARIFLPIPFVQFRLRIEQIHLARTPVLK